MSPAFKFVGDNERVFPDLGLTVKPGDVVDRDENPDPVFFEAVEAASGQSAESVPEAAPAAPPS